jgi:hypothetical protein
MSDTCASCGGEIIFRYMDGRRTPIHLSGGCSADYSPVDSVGSVRSAPSQFADDFCRRTTCHRCGHAVFFIRHNGGSVWVDELGWPWPKHGCFNEPTESRQLSSLQAPAGERPADLMIGLVVWAEWDPPGQSLLLVKHQDGRTLQVRVRGNRLDLVGELVGLSRSRHLLTSLLAQHLTVPILGVETLT